MLALAQSSFSRCRRALHFLRWIFSLQVERPVAEVTSGHRPGCEKTLRPRGASQSMSASVRIAQLGHAINFILMSRVSASGFYLHRVVTTFTAPWSWCSYRFRYSRRQSGSFRFTTGEANCMAGSVMKHCNTHAEHTQVVIHGVSTLLPFNRADGAGEALPIKQEIFECVPSGIEEPSLSPSLQLRVTIEWRRNENLLRFSPG